MSTSEQLSLKRQRSKESTHDSFELITHPHIKQLHLTISPAYLQSLRETSELGFRKPFGRRFPITRYYELNHDYIRQVIHDRIHDYYGYLLASGDITPPQTAIETEDLSMLTADVCMSALYAKLVSIHTCYATYTDRYQAQARYYKGIEVPLPFADAINQIGAFSTRSMHDNNILVPTYRENVRNEGRSQEELDLLKYTDYVVPCLKAAGIPLKSVDTRNKSGSAWWTYKVVKIGDFFDFQCILPALHYPDNSAILAAIFLHTGAHDDLCPIIRLRPDEPIYQTRLRSIEKEFPLRAFAALAGAPESLWNTYC